MIELKAFELDLVSGGAWSDARDSHFGGNDKGNKAAAHEAANRECKNQVAQAGSRALNEDSIFGVAMRIDWAEKTARNSPVCRADSRHW